MIDDAQDTQDTHEKPQQLSTPVSTSEETQNKINELSTIHRPEGEKPGFARKIWKVLQGPSLADWLVASATVAIAITSFYQWRAINGQLREMVNSGTQTDKIVAAAQNIQTALEAANTNNQNALKTTLGQSQNALNASLAEMAKQRSAMQINADAAKSAADTAASQLELAERPWVDADISLDGPLTFNVNGANIPLKIVLRNTGHSPAQFTSISPLALIGHEGNNAANHIQDICQEAARTTTAMSQLGTTVFPNVYFEEDESIGLGKDDIEKGKASNEFPGSKFGEVFLSPAVVICIAYRSTFSQTSVYHTAYVVDLYRVDSSTGQLGITFNIGENVDQAHLTLRRGIAGPITAN